MNEHGSFSSIEEACQWACEVYGPGIAAADPTPAEDPPSEKKDGSSEADREPPEALTQEQIEELMRMRQLEEHDREVASSLADSPWERMRRECARYSPDGFTN